MSDAEYTWKSESPEDTARIATGLARHLQDGCVVLLSGTLGAGKTNFVQAALSALQYSGNVTSPTFNLVQEYPAPDLLVYHFDLYRLDDSSQLEDIDFFELVDECTPGAAFVEWADNFPNEMPEDALHIDLNRTAYIEGNPHTDTTDDTQRIIAARATGPVSESLLQSWAESCTR